MAESIRVEDNGNGTYDVLKNSRGWKYDWSLDEVLSLLRRHKISEYTLVEPDGWRRKMRVGPRGRG